MKKIAVFRGKQQIASMENGEAYFVYLLPPILGFVALDTFLSVDDKLLALIENQSRTQWELSWLKLNSIEQQKYERTVISSSNNDLPILINTGTVSSIAVSANYLPDGLDNFQFNGGKLQNFAVGAIAATHNSTISIDATESRMAKATLAGDITDVEILLAGDIAGKASSGVTVQVLYVQDATGNRTITHPTGFYAVGGTQTLNSAANTTTLANYLTFDGGTSWHYHYAK